MGDEVRVCYALQGRLTSWIMRSGLDDKDAFAMVVLASVALIEARPLSSRELLMAWREKVAYR